VILSEAFMLAAAGPRGGTRTLRNSFTTEDLPPPE
jgi:hypothetical protein